MAFASLKLHATVETNWTPAYNEAGISACNLIRYRDGLVQKLGGWQKWYQYTVSGIPRELHAWEDLNSVPHLAVGTTTQLGVITAGSLQDITPQTLVSNFAPNFTTTMGSDVVAVTDSNISNVTTLDDIFFDTPISVDGIILAGVYPIASVTGTHSYTITASANGVAGVSNGGAVPEFTTASGSSTVIVTFAAHGRSVGDDFTFPIATTGGGVTISGTYRITSVPTVDTFEIAVNINASSSATFSMNSGNTQLTYYINLGPTALGAGYGLGTYGAGGYGTGIVPASQTGTPITTTDWTMDNWGEILLACPTGGGIYQWEPNTGYQNASLVYQAPLFNGGIFIAMPEQILVAWGSSDQTVYDQQAGSLPDPLLVKWSTSLDFTNWTPLSTDQAGDFRIPTGSMIRGGIQGPQQALIFTDVDVWAMSYLGPPLVFGFNLIGTGCGLIGKHAVAVMRGNVYWMGLNSFFMLGGSGVVPIPCTVWDTVFQDLDLTNAWKCRAAPNSSFDEMTFYYPSLSGGSGENDKYVKVQVDTIGSSVPSWDYGNLARSAWIDQSVLGQPIGASPQSLIYQHEVSPDADGQPLLASYTSGWFALQEGEGFGFIDWFLPDMIYGYTNQGQNAAPTLTVDVVDFPNSTIRSSGPIAMGQAINASTIRLRGRLARFTISSNDIDTWWATGNIRYRVQLSGRR